MSNLLFLNKPVNQEYDDEHVHIIVCLRDDYESGMPIVPVIDWCPVRDDIEKGYATIENVRRLEMCIGAPPALAAPPLREGIERSLNNGRIVLMEMLGHAYPGDDDMYDNVSIEDFFKEKRKSHAQAAMEAALQKVKWFDLPPQGGKAGVCLLWEMITPEYQFHAVRRWKFDYAFIEKRVALEIEGLVRHAGHGSGKSRHTTNAGYTEDCVKYSTAASMGWLVIRVTEEMILDGTAIRLFCEALRLRKHAPEVL